MYVFIKDGVDNSDEEDVKLDADDESLLNVIAN